MATFIPKSEKELRDLLPKGQYEGFVEAAVDKIAKQSGAEMIELRVGIYDAAGNKRIVIDRLIFSDSMMWKIHGFCKSAGLLQKYDEGKLTTDDCLDRKVFCNVVEKEDDYGAKNEIKSYYLPKAEGEAKAEPAAKKPPASRKPAAPIKSDDEVPF